MATNAPAQAASGGQNDQQQAGGAQSLLSMIFRMGLMYVFFMYMRSGQKGTEIEGAAGSASGSPARFLPYFKQGEIFDMKVYLSTSDSRPQKLLWEEANVPLADKDINLHRAVTLSQEDLAPLVQKNKTIYLITRFALPGTPETPTRARGAAFIKAVPLVEFRKPQKAGEERSLLGGAEVQADDATTAVEEQPPQPPIKVILDDDDDDDQEPGIPSQPQQKIKQDDEPPEPFLKPNISICMVDMFAIQSAQSMPQHMAESLDISASERKYYPVIYYNEFWYLKRNQLPVNETLESVTLNLHLGSISNMYWTFMMAFQQSMDMQKGNGLMADKQIDELKTVFLEGNPYFLALTFCVSMLHSVFDMLAFKNDIGFWRSNKSMEGLSARTVIINAVCQLIIFLYLMDNETSTVVLVSAGVGVLIEFWKITRVMDVSVEKTASGLPKLTFKHRDSYVDSETKKWDDEAAKYLSYALFPCIIGYFIYSLLYEKHKSWYSFILQSLVGCVYTFGFVLMCPQLYLNYKLKSVAHLPWRQMTYKFLNTIIDDLFAFVIKMPLLHRLSVFRDDVIFLIYLYQRWIYRVDKSRVNEFGFSDQQPEGDGADPSAPKAVEPASGKSSAVSQGNAVQRGSAPSKVKASGDADIPTETEKTK